MLKKNNKGFTLVELLVVIAIIGILAVVAVPALFSNIEKSKVAKLEGNISAIKSAALSYYADESEFYQTITSGSSVGPKTAEQLSDANNGLGSYLENIKSVFNGETYTISGTTSAGNGSVLTINLTQSLGAKSISKLVNDLGLTSGSDSNNSVSAKQIKVEIIKAK